LTIPPGNDEQWDRRFAVAFPFCSLTFFFLAAGIIDFSGLPPFYYWILLVIAFLCSFIIYYTTKQQHAPKRFIILYAICSFVMSLVWIWWVANVLIDLLSLFGVIFSIRAAFLGVTVLAWGNSVGDMIANLAVSKKGFAKMAMTGCIAGPLFNLFFGLGISLVKGAISGNISKFSFNNNNSVLPTVCGAFLFVNLGFMLISSFFTKFILYKWQAIFQILIFIAAMVVLSILSFTVS
jgi:sodium/potassium/calcium exchanger 6